MTFISQYIILRNHIAVFVMNKEKNEMQVSHAKAFSMVYQT